MVKTLKQNLISLLLGGAIATSSLLTLNYFHKRAESCGTPEVKEAIQIQRVLKKNPSSVQETENTINALARYSQLLLQDKTLPQQIKNYERFSNYQLGSMACFWSFLGVMVFPNAYSLARRVFRKEGSSNDFRQYFS